jgi:hypothetical protein
MEETLSTLDYALRAKSISNKPEVNQRMTRNALLKEYVAEIERLKADVMAAREKNGIFFSEENWNKINSEHELKVTEAEESRRQIEVIEGQLRAVREEFEQSMALLMKTDGELKETKVKLNNSEKEVERKDGELIIVKGALEEETVVRQAHQKTELALNGVSTQLRKVAHDSLSDLDGVFDKLGTCLSQHLILVSDAFSRPQSFSSQFKFESCQDTWQIRPRRIPGPRSEARNFRPNLRPTLKKDSSGDRTVAKSRAGAALQTICDCSRTGDKDHHLAPGHTTPGGHFR